MITNFVIKKLLSYEVNIQGLILREERQRKTQRELAFDVPSDCGRRGQTVQLQDGYSAPLVGCEKQPGIGKECGSAENQYRHRPYSCGRKPPLSGADADGRLCYHRKTEKRLPRNRSEAGNLAETLRAAQRRI